MSGAQSMAFIMMVCIVMFAMMIMRLDCQRDINRGEQRKHKGLDERNKDSKGQKDNGNNKRGKPRKSFKHKMVAIDIAKKT